MRTILLLNFQINQKQDFHSYNTRNKLNIPKTVAKSNWGHLSTKNITGITHNTLRGAKSLRTSKDSYERQISLAIFTVVLIKIYFYRYLNIPYRFYFYVFCLFYSTFVFTP